MGIAIVTMSGLFAPLQGLINWFMPPASRGIRRPARPASTCVARPAWVKPDGSCPAKFAAPSMAAMSAASAASMFPAASQRKAYRPLRVLRVLEASHASSNAGRMRISGRMADVCAELDRLAAAELRAH